MPCLMSHLAEAMFLFFMGKDHSYKQLKFCPNLPQFLHGMWELWMPFVLLPSASAHAHDFETLVLPLLCVSNCRPPSPWSGHLLAVIRKGSINRQNHLGNTSESVCHVLEIGSQSMYLSRPSCQHIRKDHAPATSISMNLVLRFHLQASSVFCDVLALRARLEPKNFIRITEELLSCLRNSCVQNRPKFRGYWSDRSQSHPLADTRLYC